MTITLETILAKLPIGELNETIAAHIHPLVHLLPDKRLGAVVQCIILGILGSQTPVITGVWPPNIPRMMHWATAPKRLSGNKQVSGRIYASMVSLSFPIGNLARIVSSVRVIVALLLLAVVVVVNSLYHI